MPKEAKSKANPQYCCVVGCHNSNKKDEDNASMKFYRFPGRAYEKERRQEWITAVRRVNPDGTSWEPREWTRICSSHFAGNCKSDVRQHPSYVPTIFPAVYKKRAPDEKRTRRWQKRLAQAKSSQDNAGAAVQTPETSKDVLLQERSKMDVDDAFPELARSQPAECDDSAHGVASAIGKTPERTDVECQTEYSTSGKLIFFLSTTNGVEASTQVTHVEQSDKVTTTDGNWKRKCGFWGFDSLKENEEAMHDVCGVTLSVFSLLLNLLPPSRYRNSDMTSEDKLCLFLAKLRLGLTYSALAAIFCVTSRTASNTFRTILDILSVALQEFVYVPPREIIRRSMPPAFKQHYPRCTFIVDCIEVRIQTPFIPDCQHVLYSNYKGGYTLKVLVAIIPNGLIAFMSKAYGGRHTGSFIAQDSNFLEILVPGDAILSHKGFPNIKTSLEGKDTVLIMPPFNTGGGQMSEEKTEKTFQIASVRMHVERAIQRLKMYRILKNVVPITMVPHMNKVFSVCAALVNLQTPIIKK